MNTTKRRLPIPDDARIRPQYGSEQVQQNVATLNFFPALATKKVWLDNYIQNPFPGNDTRLVAGLSFDVNRQFIANDADNGINAAAIINGLKHAGVLITADQSHTQLLRSVSIEDHSNFAQTGYAGDMDKAYINGAYETASEETGIIKSSDMYELKDPFEIAPNQNVNLEVTFNDASVFPTDAQWEASPKNKGLLYLKATLYLAEIESAN